MEIGIVEYIDCAHSATIKGQPYALHGHTYKVEISVRGEVKEDIVFDFCELRKIAEEVLAKYDKKNLNEILKNSTGENLTLAIHADLKKKLPDSLMIKVKLWQGHNKWVKYLG